MICSTLSGKLAIKHPVHGILCREDGLVFRPNRKKKGWPSEWTPGCRRKDGYYVVASKRVHRLIAECFIPNPEHKPTVDHIDRNPANNAVSNLRWATQHEQHLNAKPHIERKQYSVCACEDILAYSREYYADHREKILQMRKSNRDSLTGNKLEAYRQRKRDADRRYKAKLKSRRADGTSCQCPDSAEGSQSALQ